MTVAGVSATGDFGVGKGIGLDALFAKSLLISFVCLFFYFPNAQVVQARAAATFALGLGALCFPVRIDRRAVALIVIGLAAGVEILASIVTNLSPRQLIGHGLASAFKPLYFVLMYLFGYVCVSNSPLRTNGWEVRRLFTLVASIFICTQLIIAVMQALGLAGVLDSIYYQEKTRDVSTILRATGTIGNPNSLAFYTLQCFFFVLLLGTANWLWKTLLLFFGACLIALTGSRSVLIVLILCLILFVFFRRKSLAAWIAYSCMTLLFVTAVAIIVQTYAEYFRYLSQLQLLFTTDSPLRRISSMAARMEHWHNSLELFRRQEGVAKYFLGLGDRVEYTVLDNDYLYVMLRHGVFGLVAFYGFFALLATRYFQDSMGGSPRFFGFLIFFAAVVLGCVGESFANWYHMVFFVVLTGVLSAVQSPIDWIRRER